MGDDQMKGNNLLIKENSLDCSDDDEKDDSDEAPQVDLFGDLNSMMHNGLAVENELDEFLSKGSFGFYAKRFRDNGITSKAEILELGEDLIPFIIENGFEQRRFYKFLQREKL